MTTESPPEQPSTLLVLATQSGLDAGESTQLVTSFKPFAVQAEDWKAKVAALCQPGKIPTKADGTVAKASRLVLKNIRVEASKMKDSLKEDVLKRGRAIDSIFKHVESTIKPLEDQLTQVEKYAEIQDEKRKAALKASREEQLRPYLADTSVYALDLMDDRTFTDLFTGIKTAHDARLELARKAEEDRLAKELADQAERERMRVENERLKGEAAAKDLLLKQEREKAEADKKALEEKAKKDREAAAEVDRLAKEEAKRLEAIAVKQRAELATKRETILIPFEVDTAFIDLGRMSDGDFKTLLVDSKTKHLQLVKKREDDTTKEKERKALEAKAKTDKEAADAQSKKDREAREKIERELAAAKAVEEKKRADAEKALKAAAAAPDVDKVKGLAATVRALVVPAMSTKEGKELRSKIESQLVKFATWLETEAGRLEP